MKNIDFLFVFYILVVSGLKKEGKQKPFRMFMISIKKLQLIGERTAMSRAEDEKKYFHRRLKLKHQVQQLEM